VGKEWERVTESAAVAFPAIYAALKKDNCERLILLAHSQGTILSAVMLELLKGLHPPIHDQWVKQPAVSPEGAVARKLAKRWDFERSMRAARTGQDAQPDQLPAFDWPGHGRRQPEAITREELCKLEMYCFSNCATEMLPVKIRGGFAPWMESYGNEKDIVARLGVLANVSGPGSVRIGGDKYCSEGAWGHLLNAHYLYPIMQARDKGDPAGGLVLLKSKQLKVPRLFTYLDAKTPLPAQPVSKTPARYRAQRSLTNVGG
jgi:hypothetical protein